jgi:hypothetical protein
MSWGVFGMEVLVKTAILSEANKRFTESTGLLRGDGILRPVPHLGDHCHEQVGYLDWIDIDDTIRYVSQKFGSRYGAKTGRTKRRTPNKRQHLRSVKRATSSAGTPQARETKPPSPAGTRRK